jgi:hypothetical protein
MEANEQSSSKDKKPWWKRINLEFYYMQKAGSRYYLRVTPFFWIMMILSLVLFFGFLLYQKYQEEQRYKPVTQPTAAPAERISRPSKP